MSTEVATTDDTSDETRIQKFVLRHIGKKNAREMAAELGVSPDAILRAKRDLVESVDELTLQVKKLRLIETLQDIADDAQQAAESVSDERNKAGLYNSSISAMKTVLTELNRTSKQESEAVAALNRQRVMELVELVQETVDESVAQISEEFDLDAERLFEIFNTNLGRAAERRDAEVSKK